MKVRTATRGIGYLLGTLWLCAFSTAQAETISVTYTLNGTASGDPTNPPLITSARGSLSPLGSMTWQDLSFPNLTTGTNRGTFTATFAQGDTLVGNLYEQFDLSFPLDAAPLTQVIEVTGGTGAFLWYNGTLTGSGTVNLLTGTFSASGSGRLNTTPEPSSVALLPIGFLCLVAYRRRGQRSHKNPRAIKQTTER